MRRTAVLLFFCGMLAFACARRSTAPVAGTAPRVETFSSGPVEVSITADPPAVDPARDILLTIRLSAPTNVEVHLPPLNDRFQGLVMNGEFEDESRTSGGMMVKERHLRLTPELAEKYRLAPIAVTYTDRSKESVKEEWFATRPIVFEARPSAGKAGKDIDEIAGPVWIYPPPRFFFLWGTVALLLFAVGAVAWKFRHRIRRAIRFRLMSPRERALAELSELIAKDLIAKDQVKEFYFELTMIVRRYIERAHRVRAPEQTTEEFLAAISNDSRFSTVVVTRLKAFLEAADLVKYAAYRPPPEVVQRATGTAKDYVETDASDEEARNPRSEIRNRKQREPE